VARNCPRSRAFPSECRPSVEGAISVLAEYGMGGLTHRCVARAARVSLASTTYHFDGKFDIVAAVSQAMFDQDPLLLRQLDAVEATQRADASDPRSWIIAFLAGAAGRARVRAACWSEIVLDAPRHAESLALAQQWFAAATANWRARTSTADEGNAELDARSCGDVAVGLLVMVLALGLDESDVRAVLEDGADPLDRWRSTAEAPLVDELPRGGEKSARTREAIIEATLDELVSKGQMAIGLKTMASKAGLSPSGAFYHFPTSASLLAAAQRRLFGNAKARYRAVNGGAKVGHSAA